MRILFVENHPEFTTTVVESFLAADEVIVVPTIAAAREQILGSRFDIALVDYDLDDGKGDELVRWVRSTRADLKVVAVSARETGNDALLAAGAHAVCPKIGFSQIQTVLQKIVGDPAVRPRPRIYADFNGLMGSPRDTTRSMVPLDTWVSLRDPEQPGWLTNPCRTRWSVMRHASQWSVEPSTVPKVAVLTGPSVSFTSGRAATCRLRVGGGGDDDDGGGRGGGREEQLGGAHGSVASQATCRARGTAA